MTQHEKNILGHIYFNPILICGLERFKILLPNSKSSHLLDERKQCKKQVWVDILLFQQLEQVFTTKLLLFLKQMFKTSTFQNHQPLELLEQIELVGKKIWDPWGPPPMRMRRLAIGAAKSSPSRRLTMGGSMGSWRFLTDIWHQNSFLRRKSWESSIICNTWMMGAQLWLPHDNYIP